MAGVSMASAAVVRGRVTDTAGEPLAGATVSLLRQDSTLVDGVSSNVRGAFVMSKVAKGKYIVKADYIGYEPVFSNISVKTASDTLRLPAIKLAESSIMLKEAVVHGVATPVKVMEDTIQYAADAYKTPPNAAVEDLLKRLPGVEVDKSGSITAQGQKVTKILINGEETFGDDPTVVSKNLSVDIVQNAQVITRKSDLARLTGVDDGEDETVINLTIKKGMNHGWNGSVEAGYGTDDRWMAKFNVFGRQEKNQFMIFGNFNNINDQGFVDTSGGRFRRFGGTNGINTTQALGLNFTLVPNERLRIGGEVLYNYSDRDNRSTTHQINLLQGDDNSTENSETASRDKTHNLRAGLRIRWTPDSFNTVDFRPNFSYFINDTERKSYVESFNSSDAISQSRNVSGSSGYGYDLNGRFIYNWKSRSRRGRSFSVSANYALSDTREDETVWSRNAFWMRDSLYEDYQEIDNHAWNNSVDSRISYVEPVGDVKNGNFIEFAYQMNYRWNNADKDVRHQPFVRTGIIDDPDYEQWQEDIWRDWYIADRITGLNKEDLIIDEENSNHFRNDFFSQQLRVGYRKVASKYNLNAGISLNPSMSKSVNLTNSDKTIPTRWVWNYAPFLRFRYRFSKQTSANIFYNGRSTQPSLTQLQPVADTSDPMNIVQGNPSLNPSFTHSMRLRYQTNDPDKQQSIMVMGFAQMEQNAVVSNTTFNRETGGRVTRYENVNGNWSARLMTMYSRPLGATKLFSINNFLSLNASQEAGFTDGFRNTSTKFGFSESVGFAYRPDNMEFEIRPRYSLSTSSNSIQNGQDQTVHLFGGRFTATYYTKFGLVLSSDLDYSDGVGYSAGYDVKSWMWNASVGYQFLRDRNATISLKGNDLLQQRKSISRTETAQAITDISYNNLTRYFMLTFTYKFNTNKKKGSSADEENFGGFGPGGYGRGPMGPPSGGGPRF
ncbi:MAG: outer membrane beta-barrel protein [Muribaculaceae bacterium]|nr:outer membrane beta-barrel protein [Muribaculaceae bacterium]